MYNTFNAFKSPCTFCNFLVVTGVSNTLHLFPKARFSHIRGCINYKYVCKLYIISIYTHKVAFSSHRSIQLKRNAFPSRSEIFQEIDVFFTANLIRPKRGCSFVHIMWYFVGNFYTPLPIRHTKLKKWPN